jgi:hypothetical protein
MHVTQEGPDILSRYCPVQAFGSGGTANTLYNLRAGMDVGQTVADRDVMGGVDTHKDLHVAAVVDELDRVLESRCFATTRHGYKQMLTWMRSFGQLRRVGVEATGNLWRGAPALHAKRWRRGSGGHDAGHARSPQARQKTMIWMPRMPRTQPSRAALPSRPKAVMEWSNPCAC